MTWETFESSIEVGRREGKETPLHACTGDESDNQENELTFELYFPIMIADISILLILVDASANNRKYTLFERETETPLQSENKGRKRERWEDTYIQREK